MGNPMDEGRKATVGASPRFLGMPTPPPAIPGLGEDGRNIITASPSRPTSAR